MNNKPEIPCWNTQKDFLIWVYVQNVDLFKLNKESDNNAK